MFKLPPAEVHPRLQWAKHYPPMVASPMGYLSSAVQGGNKFGNHMKNKEERGYGIL